MIIRRFETEDAPALFSMMEEEGTEWSAYYVEAGRPRYLTALLSNCTFVAWEDELLCGYLRCREDEGFGVYVYDLLVRPSCRGRELGKKLLEHAAGSFPGQALYVMSDADPYYEKMGYDRIGSVLQAPQKSDK